MNLAKKILALLIAFTMLMSTVVFADETDDIFAYLSSLGIMIGDETGDFHEENTLTRAEFSAIAARLLRVPNINQEQIFADVSADHWANGYISQIYKMGIIAGTGEGLFSPDSPVTYEQAIKILVGVLGYGEEAEKKGGFPSGYLGMGISLKLNHNLEIKGDFLSRAEIAQMVYNALEAYPLTNYGNPDYTKEDRTLGEIISSSMDVVRIAGVVSETNKTSLIYQTPSLLKGEAMVDGAYIRTDKDLKVGYYAEIYATETRGKYNLVSVNYPDEWNSVTDADAENVEFSGNQVTIYDENGEELKKLLLESGELKIIYNGRLASLSEHERIINYGKYSFLNNDADREIDVLFINEAQSFIVDRVNPSNSTVYFTRGQVLNGRSAVMLEAKDDEIIFVCDSSGNPLLIENIQSGNVITVFASQGMKYIEAFVTSDAIEGEITELSNESVIIGDKEYKPAVKPDGTTYFTATLGENSIYALDIYGNIVDSISDVVGNFKYAYVIQAGRTGGLSSAFMLRTVSGGEPQKEVKLSGDIETISYYFQNNVIETYELADSIKLDGTKVNISEINPSSLEKNLIAFKLNTDGEIREINSADFSSHSYREHAFNADLISFGGENVSRGYVTDSQTMFICVPESGSVKDEDYYVQIKITDDTITNKVAGTVFFPDSDYEDPDAEPVDILIISADMDSAVVPTVQRDSEICIVGNVSQTIGEIFDDEGEAVTKLELLKGSKIITEVVKSGTTASGVASKLRKGDLIRYTKDGFGRIVNIQKLVSSQGLGTDYTNDLYIGAGSESAIYGMAYHTTLNTYDYYTNQMVDKLQLTYSTDGSGSILSTSYRLPIKTPPDIYAYNRTTGVITPGNTEDIATFTQVGSSADNILAVIESNDIKAIVIIVD